MVAPKQWPWTRYWDCFVSVSTPFVRVDVLSIFVTSYELPTLFSIVSKGKLDDTTEYLFASTFPNNLRLLIINFVALFSFSLLSFDEPNFVNDYHTM